MKRPIETFRPWTWNLGIFAGMSINDAVAGKWIAATIEGAIALVIFLVVKPEPESVTPGAEG